MQTKKFNKEELISKIKEKKELTGIAREVTEEFLDNYLKKYKIQLEKITKSQEKVVIKYVRSELRLLVGRYQKSVKRKKIGFDAESLKKLLLTHSSTAERINFYPKLKKIISDLKIKSILDLGCGLNPLALASQEYIYFASDIKEDELKIINDFFKYNSIQGKTFTYDIRKIQGNLPEADLCLIFKVLDILCKAKKQRAELTEKILTSVNCKMFLISFSTRKLSGKKMNFPNRVWFEKILAKLKMEFNKFESSDELFYLIKK